jgi:hypothetical protein
MRAQQVAAPGWSARTIRGLPTAVDGGTAATAGGTGAALAAFARIGIGAPSADRRFDEQRSWQGALEER